MEQTVDALVARLEGENAQLRAAQASCELAVSRAVSEVDAAFTWLEKFVDLAGGQNVCGEHFASIGGGEGNNPWANALEVLTERASENVRLLSQLRRLVEAAEYCLGGWTNVKQRDDLRAVLNDIAAENRTA